MLTLVNNALNAPSFIIYVYPIILTQTIEERGNRTTYNLHTLFLDLDQTKIALDNATNQLMSLQHKQFVENRVQDDDETLANADNVPIQADQTNSKVGFDHIVLLDVNATENDFITFSRNQH